MGADEIPPSKRELPTLFDDETEIDPGSRRQCVDCGLHAPATSSNHSLISAKFGWRLSRTTTPNGTVHAWRCPACWQKHRDSGGA